MRVVHCKRSAHDVYIGRPSKWGNPYSALDNSIAEFKAPTREASIEMYEKFARQELAAGRLDLTEIAGKTLGCWCAPKTCHGDVLVKLCRENGLIE